MRVITKVGWIGTKYLIQWFICGLWCHCDFVYLFWTISYVNNYIEVKRVFFLKVRPHLTQGEKSFDDFPTSERGPCIYYYYLSARKNLVLYGLPAKVGFAICIIFSTFDKRFGVRSFKGVYFT